MHGKKKKKKKRWRRAIINKGGKKMDSVKKENYNTFQGEVPCLS